ncbi:MAG TPA: hypothetical protein VF911_09955, partial [Thermoanaerobaculia bacterium]
SGKTMTLDGGSFAAGDTWRGVYRFGTLKLRNVTLRSTDRITWTTLDSVSSSVINNADAPLFALPSQIVVENTATASYVKGPAGAVTDADKPIKLVATNSRTLVTYNGTANNDGSFRFAVGGAAGDTFTLVATDSHADPLSSDPLTVNGAMADVNHVTTLTISPAAVVGGTSATGTVRLRFAAAADTQVALASSNTALATAPSSVTVQAGANEAQFTISTTAGSGNVTITATLETAVNATLTVTDPANALSSLTVDPNSVDSGTSVNGIVTLGTAAPAGGAVIALSSSDSTSAIVPASVTIPEGQTSATFTIKTQRVGATATVTISASYAATKNATLTLNACTPLRLAPQPGSAPGTVWFDDAVPANATASGTPLFDSTQAASGTKALHFAAATGARDWSFSGATPLAVGPNDELVLYALVDPCNPPRQIAATWSGIAQSANWGESLIALSSFKSLASIPAGSIWVRLSVLAKNLGVTTNVNVTGLTLRVHGGEAWFDLGGKSACSIARAAEPERHARETVW